MRWSLNVSYNITYSKDAAKYLNGIPLKHAKVVEEKIKECLAKHPMGKVHATGKIQSSVGEAE